MCVWGMCSIHSLRLAPNKYFTTLFSDQRVGTRTCNQVLQENFSSIRNIS